MASALLRRRGASAPGACLAAWACCLLLACAALPALGQGGAGGGDWDALTSSNVTAPVNATTPINATTLVGDAGNDYDDGSPGADGAAAGDNDYADPTASPANKTASPAVILTASPVNKTASPAVILTAPPANVTAPQGNASAPASPSPRPPQSPSPAPAAGNKPTTLTFDTWKTTEQASPISSYAGLTWTGAAAAACCVARAAGARKARCRWLPRRLRRGTGTPEQSIGGNIRCSLHQEAPPGCRPWGGSGPVAIYNGKRAIGKNLVAGVRSQPNALDFIPGKTPITISVPKGSNRLFAPHSVWATYVEDYNYPERDEILLVFTGYDAKDTIVGQIFTLLKAGVPNQIDFPLSFRQGITRMTIAPQPTRKTAGSDPAQIEFAMDDFTLVLPYAPKPATAANGTAQVGAKIEKYAGIPFVPDYYAYCDAKAAEARPECLRYSLHAAVRGFG
ncbi:hypothetical protein MNEG_12952 [Monoraphidium neglectum]|uniref:Uncharacterized protein n=1 Tax=Monoraphidium neglectum TaxID=145388 RepID=A0A0D2M0G6_9CHLO|nr:hypothetical protein MNEG_12952 [Monoraphidium neglectum]KIY95011.1 hypothetical protein MNEG_12952 [Monoraphidium neglectum]|eukprot:XP_013894031.1 hypothetical protein MNEG_12952 [Monoraphidium neglectum]